MSQTLTSLLVGAHFRPPAKIVLAHLPAGASLILEPEPDNPYDEHAIKVLVPTTQIPAEQYIFLESELPLMGSELGELLLLPEVWLGYVAATGGKPLAAYPQFQGNAEIEAMLTQFDCMAELGFASDGTPLVLVSVP